MLRRHALLAILVVALGCKRETPSALLAGSSAPPPAAPPPAARPDVPAGAAEAAGIRYLERLTGGATATEPLPMIVAIHGRGDRADNFVRVLGGFHSRARLIFPYGTDPIDEGFEWFPMSSRTPPDAFAADVERAAHRVAKMIEALEKERPTRGLPIVTGFSQGGFLSFALAILHPELVGEAIPMSGRLPRELWPTSWPPGKVAPPIHAFHGDADPLVPIDEDRQLVQRLKQLGFPADLHEYPGVRHTVSPEMSRDFHAMLAEAAERARRR